MDNFARIDVRCPIARKWCKAVKTIEEEQVSWPTSRDFHKLINTCVEIFTELKYRARASAPLVLHIRYALCP